VLIFDEVTAEHITRLGFIAGEGLVVSIRATSAHEVELLTSLALGLRKPDSGSVSVFGKEAGMLDTEDGARFAVAFGDGGLISNLSIYENITLPSCYHKGVSPDSLMDEAAGILEKMGIPGGRVAGYDTLRPSDVPAFERRIAGVCRALLLKPDLIVYESILDGLRLEVKDMLADAIADYHNADGKRASVFIGLDEGPGEYLRPDLNIRL
jgi:ABC-type transporter Mla maintaining outer membrane lipid asymmetry ATPase subunit MlaF